MIWSGHVVFCYKNTMRKSIRRLILKIHLIIGLITGLVIFVEAMTGAIYVFSVEISEWVYSQRREIQKSPEQEEHLPISQLCKVAKEAIDDEAPLVLVYVPNNPTASVLFSFEKTNDHALFYGDYMETSKTVYLNPYTAEIVKIENTKWEFFNVVLWLHLTLLLGYEIGSQIVSWSVVGFVLMIISGLILWWPKNKKTRKKRFSFDWKSGFGIKRKIFDLHTILGFYVLSVAFIIAMTGLYYSFSIIGKSMRWIANGGETIERPYAENPAPIDSTLITNPLDFSVQKTRNQSPCADSYVIKMPRGQGHPIVTRAYMSHHVFYDRTVRYFDAETGQLLQSDEMSDLTNGEKYGNMNYDIHVGAIGGLPTKILAFLSCLIIASLPVTGLMIWRNKSYRI